LICNIREISRIQKKNQDFYAPNSEEGKPLYSPYLHGLQLKRKRILKMIAIPPQKLNNTEKLFRNGRRPGGFF